jgi:hypothetical protein
MGLDRPSRRNVFVLLLAIGFGTALWLPGLVSGPARADGVLRATSVCDAHELKARKALQPALEIEIPPEFDRPFPTAAACRSHDAAWDEAAPGPNQPIPFSHKHHAGDFQIDCLYCHPGTDRSRMAGVPSVEMCMGCHAAFAPEYDQLEGIRILKQHWAEQRPVQWVQLHRSPEHVKFQHQAHVRGGLTCQICHGPVEELDKLYLVPDTQIGPAGLPTQKLQMGWCINCHRSSGVSQDCFICHY